MQRRHQYGSFLRILAFFVFMIGAVIFSVDLYQIAKQEQSSDMSVSWSLLRPALIDFLPAIGFAGMLWGLGMLLERRPESNNRIIDATERSAHLLEEVKTLLEQTAHAPPSAPAAPSYIQHAAEPPPPPRYAPPPLPAYTPPSPAPAGADLNRTMERVVTVLDEIRQLSLLDESQKKTLLKSQAEKRRASDLVAAAAHIRLREWGKAERLIESLEATTPGDAETAGLRQNLAAGRTAAESEALSRLRTRVEDLMAISSWDQAEKQTADFVENFPQNREGAALLSRVQHERNLFMESTVHRLYEEIKAATERRQWRKAFSGAQRLTQKFPDHRKTQKIRAQMQTLQDNAELEERQETEQRIHELLHAKRFPEAIELAEYLLDRYPNSAAAASLEELLPKMRQLAIEHDLGLQNAAADYVGGDDDEGDDTAE